MQIGKKSVENRIKRHLFRVFSKKKSKILARFQKYVYICTKNLARCGSHSARK